MSMKEEKMDLFSNIFSGRRSKRRMFNIVMIHLFVFLFIFIPLSIQTVEGGRSTLTVEWDEVTDPDVDEIKLYRYSDIIDLDDPDHVVTPPVTEATFENIPNGTWKFQGVAFDNGVPGAVCAPNEIIETFQVQAGCLSNFRKKAE